MEQNIRKFFPQEPKFTIQKPTTGRSNFKSARKITDFHIGTPASTCISLREMFDKHITEKYSEITEEQKYELWASISNQMLSEPSERLEEVIENYILEQNSI